MAVIRIVKGDLLDAKEDVIAHQVNCRGVMGAGVAKQIREKWPYVYHRYRECCYAHAIDPKALLGYCQFVHLDGKTANRNLIVSNLFGQVEYGRGKSFTDEEGFRRALNSMSFMLKNRSHNFKEPLATIAMPYKIGCGLAGGNWDNIYKIIEEELTDFDVTLYELE